MCWMCGAVRPYDGAHPKKDNWKNGYITEEGAIAVPNEAASWEDELIVWPEWDQVDSQGVPFFLIVPANAEPGGESRRKETTMCETCSQCPIPISREDFEHCVQTPTCPECGRVVPADEAWQVYDPPTHRLPEPSLEVLRKLAALDE